MTKGSGCADIGCLHRVSLSFVPPDLGENEMQLSCFKPEQPSLWFQFRHGSNHHAKKMLRFASLFSTGSDALQKFFFGNRVIGFDVIGANTCRCGDELTNNPIRDGVLWNRLCKI